jgi:hypothetical protein
MRLTTADPAASRSYNQEVRSGMVLGYDGAAGDVLSMIASSPRST